MMESIRARMMALMGRFEREQSQTVTPASIAVPRIIFLVTALALTLFGMLMIYSSSSVTGATSETYDYNPAYFLTRQVMFAAIGLVLAIILARLDYHIWRGNVLMVLWAITVFLLVVVYTPLAGRDAYGATRWIAMGPFTLQPSEFAKVIILLVGAQIAEKYFWEGSIDNSQALKLLFVGVLIPLFLVLWQPDKGTTGVVVITLLIMCYLAGASASAVGLVGIGVGVAAIAYSLKDDYSRARILTMFNPSNDPYGAGYQLTQGFYAFGSGGLTGLGIGMSRQKYNYLPMAHNDFIFAIVGEELGLLGTVGMLAVFALLLWSGLKIAQAAPDVAGRLIAAGCTSMLIVQLLLNVSGVLGIFPLTGKPVPFVSYGGSSIISCLLLTGLVTSVSLRSKLPETAYEARRRQLRLADERTVSRAGTWRERAPEPAYTEKRDQMPRRNFRVIEGGEGKVRSAQLAGGGYRRVDLGPSAAERLRDNSKRR